MMNTTYVNTKTDHPYFCMDDMLRVKYNVIFNMNTTSVTTWKHWKCSIQAINKFCKEDNFYKIYAEPEYYSSLIESNTENKKTSVYYRALISFYDRFPKMYDSNMNDDALKSLEENVQEKDLLNIHSLITEEQINKWRKIYRTILIFEHANNCEKLLNDSANNREKSMNECKNKRKYK
jgi:hypothetical protein